ncbi:hypothetical protein [Phenylobacterium sp.]|uniref:hypothetical protein n=1 Tax=Phenylobacterium sp. TaxID=1871053 RepID=UPI0025FAC0AD|nr:hypothetical protein [Phenylobacterium sp.]
MRRFELSAIDGSPERALTILHDPEQKPPYLSEPAVASLEAFLRARQTRTAADQARALHLLRPTYPRYLVMADVLFGRLDDAFTGLADPRLDPEATGQLLFEPLMVPVRQDPRFWPVAARAGLVDYWRRRGVWPDFRRDPAHPIDCQRAADRAAPPRR